MEVALRSATKGDRVPMECAAMPKETMGLLRLLRKKFNLLV